MKNNSYLYEKSESIYDKDAKTIKKMKERKSKFTSGFLNE